MLPLVSITNFFTGLKRSSDDAIDRAHYIFTVGFLIISATLIASNQTFGTPIQCLTAAQYTGEWTRYVNSYCYVTQTLISPSNVEDMPDVQAPNYSHIEINYYQWIPYVLIAQAIFFLIPHFFWNFSQTFSEIDFNHILEKCGKARSEVDSKILEKIVADVCNVMHYRALKSREGVAGLGCLGLLMYLISKLMNVINLLSQLYFLSYFIGQGHSDWGFQVLQSFTTIMNPIQPSHYVEPNHHANVSGSDLFFPRITFCRFRHSFSFGDTKVATVQCLLMMNILNEKLYALMYVWFYVLLAVTFANFLYTVFRLCTGIGIQRSRVYLQIHNVSEHASAKFINRKLGSDGLLLLHLIKNHVGFSTASDVAYMLYVMENQVSQGGSEQPCVFISSTSPTGDGFDPATSFLAKKLALLREH